MKILAWWSGGITSAAACKIVIDQYGKDCVDVVFIDTMNEHPDTYRFLMDCEHWYGKSIKSIKNPNYTDIREVWLKYLSLNVANGAICSSELKRATRIKYQKEHDYDHQVFGFEFGKKEFNRAESMKLNYPDSKPIFPLLQMGMYKEDCIQYVQDAGIEVPMTYKMGYNNNNCFQTGCVQGGIGYWQQIKRQEPKKFYRMAVWEHLLTDLKGEPVTMLKDREQGKSEKLFLVPHPDYPNINDISQKKGRPTEPLMECNGFCGLDDLNKNEQSMQIGLLF
jgi:3'-phosphoadenosine 5'-phosphosulfate sulfotransferase (PAPS reductase)/FAD synthetase